MNKERLVGSGRGRVVVRKSKPRGSSSDQAILDRKQDFQMAFGAISVVAPATHVELLESALQGTSLCHVYATLRGDDQGLGAWQHAAESHHLRNPSARHRGGSTLLGRRPAASKVAIPV